MIQIKGLEVTWVFVYFWVWLGDLLSHLQKKQQRLVQIMNLYTGLTAEN
jgi:hypothetical protein